mmetsp:Transcript_30754/g.35070  ORF Transcript_30754/g.35070 Transcript_30754/m.35070 type:complete len:371 (+) Transcript_30754:87-1199(+)
MNGRLYFFLSALLLFFQTSCHNVVVFGLVETTKPFTKHITLPPLDRIPRNEQTLATRDFPNEPVPVVYTNDLSSVEKWVNQNIYDSKKTAEQSTILGWDMESTPNLPWREHQYTKHTYFGPATLQLSTSQSALLVPIARDGVGIIHSGGLPNIFHQLLEDSSIIPVGVGLDDDMVELYRWCLEYGDDEEPAWSMDDAENICRRFDMGGIGAAPGTTAGLARLVASILGVKLVKNNNLARTHWSKAEGLKLKEISYAARDAWAAVAVLDRLGEMDQERFGLSAIQETLEEQIRDSIKPLRGIREVSNRKILRKPYKDEWKHLRFDFSNAENSEKPSRTKAQQDRLKELEKITKELVPTPPIRYEITDSLGL